MERVMSPKTAALRLVPASGPDFSLETPDDRPTFSRVGYGTPGNGWKDGSKPRGLLLTLLVYAVLAALALLQWQTHVAPKPPAISLTAFDVAAPAAPQEPVREVPPGPEQVETPRVQAQPAVVEMPAPLLRIAAPAPLPAPKTVQAADPAPPVEKTTAPPVAPAPPARQASNDKATWEGLVLAALDKVKRYPREAQFRRQQGVPYIRFVIDRNGKVLSSTLERSSGVRSLDQEAVSLPKRAQPLPKPPQSREGATIELVVPVEFFLAG